jgi:hypothetical protein
MSLRLSLLACLILALIPVRGVLAQEDSPDPAQIARLTARVINARTDWAVGSLRETVDGTTQRIRRLHAAGATDREIIAAGQAGATRAERIARTATDAIQGVTRRGVSAMVAAGAEREMVARVLTLSSDAQDTIAAAAERAQHAIRAVVRRALG